MSLSESSDEFVQGLGEHVVRLCQKQGVSRANLVRRSGLAIGEIAKIERGWGGATLMMYRRIAGALGVPLSEIFDESKWPRRT